MNSEATPGSQEVLDCLVDFINNIVLAGIIPDKVCRIFYGASLMALSKKDDGVRPIASAHNASPGREGHNDKTLGALC